MVATHYVWDPIEDNICRVLSGAGDTISELVTEPYQFGRVQKEIKAGETCFFHFDGQGNSLAITDTDAAVVRECSYSAFGEITATNGTSESELMFGGEHGYRTDSVTGLIAIRSRDYSPGLARWLSQDPSYALLGAIGYPRDSTQYMFARQNPCLYIDPSGLQVEVDQGKCLKTTVDFGGSIDYWFQSYLGNFLGGDYYTPEYRTVITFAYSFGMKCCCTKIGGQTLWKIVNENQEPGKGSEGVITVKPGEPDVYVLVDKGEVSYEFKPGGTRNLECKQAEWMVIRPFAAGDLCQCREWTTNISVKNTLRGKVTLGSILSALGMSAANVAGLADKAKISINEISFDIVMYNLACCDGNGSQVWRSFNITTKPFKLSWSKPGDESKVPSNPAWAVVNPPVEDKPSPVPRPGTPPPPRPSTPQVPQVPPSSQLPPPPSQLPPPPNGPTRPPRREFPNRYLPR